MTGKRFNLIEVNGNIEDSCTQAVYDGGEDVFELLDCMNALHEEKKRYKRLWEQMAYYFIGTKSLNDLDHKDFEVLKELAKGNEYELTDEEKEEVYRYLQAYHNGNVEELKYD